METVLEGRTMAVGIDYARLTGAAEGTDTRYTVGLSGYVDGRFAAAYQAAQAESTGFRRFKLNAAAGTVSFSCRMVDGPAQVFDVLQRLEALLEIVNRQTI
jgi:hypothetical protein